MSPAVVHVLLALGAVKASQLPGPYRQPITLHIKLILTLKDQQPHHLLKSQSIPSAAKDKTVISPASQNKYFAWF